MHRFATVAVFLVAIQGCSGKEGPTNVVPAGAPLTATADSARAQMMYMAVQNSISIEVDESKVATLYESGQTACRDASADGCVLLESQIATGSLTTASLKFRAKPSGIRKLLAAFGTKGTITRQSTASEDLSAPIADTGKKLAMLNDYRSKLEGLLGRASTDIDALIKVNRELAQVQSELESMTGSRANLTQRVETQILVVSIAAAGSQSSWKLITGSFTEFAANLARGISSAITGIAYLAPWSVSLLLFAWLGRRLWRWQRRARSHDA